MMKQCVMEPRKWQHQSPKKKWRKWSTKVPLNYSFLCIKAYFQAAFVQEIPKRSCTWSKWHNASRSAPKCNETTLFAVLCDPNLSKQRWIVIQFDTLVALLCVLGRDFQTASYHRWAPQALGEHSSPTLKGLLGLCNFGLETLGFWIWYCWYWSFQPSLAAKGCIHGCWTRCGLFCRQYYGEGRFEGATGCFDIHSYSDYTFTQC